MAEVEPRLKPFSHSQVSTMADASSHRERVVYLWGDHEALVEDLVEGFKDSYRSSWMLTADNVSSVWTADELIREMNTPPVGVNGCRFIVARDAHKLLRSKRIDTITAKWEYEARNPRLYVVMVGEEPPEGAKDWLATRGVLVRFREPTINSVGKWLSARAGGSWRYHRLWQSSWFDPSWGVRYMDHCGWSYTAALQGLKSMAVYEPYGRKLDEVLSVVPAVVHAGFVDALTLKGRRTAAVRMARGVLSEEIPMVLGAIRYRLRLYGAARSIGAELFSDRELAEKLGVEAWWWKERFKNAYPNYTEDRIRRRLNLIAEAEGLHRSGIGVGLLESVAVRW
jgi:hypothetical protein